MWFVPFHPRFLPWFDSFLTAFLEDSADVTAMLKHNPFINQVPNFIRVNSWHYEFTTPDERKINGNWWKRTDLGPFYPLPGKYRIN
ncbi:MAG: lipase maturation factor family protein [Gammaproteobacteria bacterium]|nr:lipase maturation factor family protein [Gammaproteobacteria bacterium]